MNRTPLFAALAVTLAWLPARAQDATPTTTPKAAHHRPLVELFTSQG